MEKVLHIILSLCITILFVLTINIAKITGDITINNTSLIFIGIGFFVFLMTVNILFVIKKQ